MRSRKSICTHRSRRFETKPWGTTCELIKSPWFSLHEIKVVRGGYSSVHYHMLKANYIYILTGSMDILTFKRLKLDARFFEVDTVTKCTNGSLVRLLPFQVHKFHATTDVHAFEWYASPFFVFRNDIVRFSKNGVRARGA